MGARSDIPTRRKLASAAVALTMTITVGWVSAGESAVVTAEGAAAGTLSLSDPLTGITDPLANAEPIEMICLENQTDINDDSVEALMAALDAGRPTAERVVEHRPYLQVTDLVIVPGIGPTEMDAILARGRACATPITMPPPTFDLCASEEQIDFNLATANEIRSKMKLSKPIAERVATGSPYLRLSDLIRVEGMDGPKFRRALEVGCLTPWPVKTDTSEPGWHWVSEQNGGVLEDGDWLMAVQPGVVDGDAWMSITDIDEDEYLSGDFSIHGQWATDQGVVLGMPRYQSLIGDWDEPVVIHNPDDPDKIWTGAALWRSGSGVRFVTADLSPFGETEVPVGDNGLPLFTQSEWPSGTNSALAELVLADEAWVAEDAIGAIIRDGAANFNNTQYDPIDGCTNTFQYIMDSEWADRLLTCSMTDYGDAVEWRIINNTGNLAFGFVGYPVAAKTHIDRRGGQVSYAEQTPSLMSVILREFNTGSTLYSYGGTGLTARLEESEVVVLDYDTEWIITGGAAIVSEMLGYLPVDLTSPALQVAVSRCVALQTVGFGQEWWKEIASCLLDSAADIAMAVWEPLDGRTTAAKKVKQASGVLKIAGWVMTGINLAATAGEGLAIDNTTVTMKHLYVPPPPPPGGGLGGSNGGVDGRLPSDRQDWKNAILNTGSRSYILFDNAPEIFHIPTGGDYVCFAQSYPAVWENVVNSGPWIWYNVVDDAPCDPSTYTARTIPPTATNWIIRIGETGQSYYMDADSRVWTIRDGGCFELLATDYHVLDWTPASALDTLDLVPGPVNSACP